LLLGTSLIEGQKNKSSIKNNGSEGEKMPQTKKKKQKNKKTLTLKSEGLEYSSKVDK